MWAQCGRRQCWLPMRDIMIFPKRASTSAPETGQTLCRKGGGRRWYDLLLTYGGISRRVALFLRRAARIASSHLHEDSNHHTVHFLFLGWRDGPGRRAENWTLEPFR